MTNKEFLLEVQKSCHIEMPRCLMLMGCLQKMLGNAAVDQVSVVLSGLGVFTSHKHPEYVQEDPETGAMTMYPPRITYHFQSEQNAEGTPCAMLLAEYAHVEQEEASSFVDALVIAINNHLQAGEEIEAPGIGSFKYVLTHQSDLKHVDFLPCDQMKDLVNAPFACFEPYEISAGNIPEAKPVEGHEEINEVHKEVPEVVEEVPVVVEETPVVEECPDVVEETMDPAPEETPDIAETQAEEPKEAIKVPAPIEVPEPKICVHKDGHIMIKESENNSDDKSFRRTLYISLALIMAGCGFLLWMMFGGDVRFFDDPPTEAKVVESVSPKEIAEVTEVPEKIIKEEKLEIAETPAKTEPVVPVIEPEKSSAEPTKPTVEPAKPAAEPIKLTAEPAKPVKETSKDFHRMKGADGKEVKVTLQAGSRLTLIALEHFGDKSFWPYIFDVNTDKLKAPNLVQSGMVLYLPDPTYYGIDANDPESVKNAKNRAAQLLK